MEQAWFAFGGADKPQRPTPAVAIDKARFVGRFRSGLTEAQFARWLPPHFKDGGRCLEVHVCAQGALLRVRSSPWEVVFRKPTTLRFNRIFDVLWGEYVVASLAAWPSGYCPPHTLRHMDVDGCAKGDECEDRGHLLSQQAHDPNCGACRAVRGSKPTFQLTVHGTGCQLGLMPLLTAVFLLPVVVDPICAELDVAVDAALDRKEFLLEPVGRQSITRELSVEHVGCRGELVVYDKVSTHRRKTSIRATDSVLQPGTEWWEKNTRFEARPPSAATGGIDERIGDAARIFDRVHVIVPWDLPAPSFLLGRHRSLFPLSFRKQARKLAVQLGRSSSLVLGALCRESVPKLRASMATNGLVPDDVSEPLPYERRWRPTRTADLLSSLEAEAAMRVADSGAGSEEGTADAWPQDEDDGDDQMDDAANRRIHGRLQERP